MLAIGWFGGRTIFRIAEQAFWALNAMAVQPFYALSREVIRHVAELALGRWLDEESRARLRAFSAAAAGLVLCAISLFIVWLIGPHTRWSAQFVDLLSPLSLIVPALANAGVILFAYCTAVTFVWGLADASMDQPRGWSDFVDARGAQAVVARGASVRRACRRRAVRISAGKRTARSARQ